MKSFVLLGLLFTTSLGFAGDVQLFNGQNLQSWRGTTFPWSVVGSLALNPTAPQSFALTAGTGVTLGCAVGKSVDIKDRKLLFNPRHDFFSLDAGALRPPGSSLVSHAARSFSKALSWRWVRVCRVRRGWRGCAFGIGFVATLRADAGSINHDFDR